MKGWTWLFCGAIALSWGTANSQKCNYLPENNLKFPEGIRHLRGVEYKSSITKKQFNELLDKIEKIYEPIFRQKGGQLKIVRLWSDDRFNAGAAREGDDWLVAMFGGMARHPKVTLDGFTQVACHEVGHHIGGAPKIEEGEWTSNEGQSDYFSTLKCMRKVFAGDQNSRFLKKDGVPADLLKTCKQAYNDAESQGVCVRIGLAGLTMTSILADFQGAAKPKVSTPSKKQVSRTSNGHPRAQCRLDTMIQGAICKASLNKDVSQTNPHTGTCSRKYSDRNGVRPLCWYKP